MADSEGEEQTRTAGRSESSLVTPEGVGPPTLSLGRTCSIQLSYGVMFLVKHLDFLVRTSVVKRFSAFYAILSVARV